MSNVRPLLFLAALAAMPAAPAAAVVIEGKDAPACEQGKPAILVHIKGFKKASGEVKVSLFGDDASRFMVRGGNLRKIFVPVKSTGPLSVCVAVPKPGRYAVAVHHDINGNGNMDAADGGGYSRNPKVSLMKRKPALASAAVQVGAQPTTTDVRLLYVKGLSLAPVDG